jgi:2-methylcitrate dehydratase PrpD
VTLQSTWFVTQLLGAMVGATSFGLSARLDSRTIENALGLAYLQASGTKLPARTVGSSSRRIYPAFAAHAGVFGGRLAALGYDGPVSWLDGPTGLGEAYFRDADFAQRARWSLRDEEYTKLFAIEAKRWPSCSLTHPYIALLRSLQANFPELFRTPHRVEIDVVPGDRTLLEPTEERLRPATIADAKYSIPFTVAVALHSDGRLKDWNEDILRDPMVAATVTSISTRIGPQRCVKVSSAAGSATLLESDLSPLTAADWTAEAVRKLRECCEYAALDESLSSRILSEVESLEDVDDVRDTMTYQLLTEDRSGRSAP